MKKSNKNATNCAFGAKKIPQMVKDKLRPLVQKLVAKCNLDVSGKRPDWEEMRFIHGTLQEIRDLEKDYVIPLPNRDENWDSFFSWCTRHGAEFKAVRIEEISKNNYGTVAQMNLLENERFLYVRRRLMISEYSARESVLGPLIKNDFLLQNMPNVQLALHLLMELLNPESHWKPYISILPSSYNTILYFTYEELQNLHGSPVLEEVFKIYRSVARQYCYFFQLFLNDAYARTLNISPYFTYDLYRWAVSTVMTRQNMVPSADGKSQILALIPLFDMCNHSNGKLSTDFILEQDALVSYACQTFSPNEEVKMFYGARTNAEFFSHNGFVYEDNEHDSFEIKLGISKSDPLFSRKRDLCASLNIRLTGSFRLSRTVPLDSELLTFVVVNVMKYDELERMLKEFENVQDALKEIGDIEQRAFVFLRDRLSLLLKSYKTTLEEDEELLQSNQSENLRLVLKLRISEKKILHHVIKHCNEQIS